MSLKLIYEKYNQEKQNEIFAMIKREHIKNIYVTKNVKFFNVNNLPSIVEKIVIVKDSLFNVQIPFLPISLKILYLNKHYTHSLDNLPNALEELVLFNDYPLPIYNLPKSLKRLSIVQSDVNYKFPIKNLPPNLEEFYFSSNYYSLSITLPKNLKTLILLHNASSINVNPNIVNINIHHFTGTINWFPNTVKDIYMKTSNIKKILPLIPSSVERLDLVKFHI